MCKDLHSGVVRPKQHILFIIDQLVEYGGAERVLLNTIRWLPTDQYRCSLVTFKLADNFPGLSDIRCPLLVWPLVKTYNLGAVKVASQLLRFIREENVSLVHTFFETSDLWAAPIAKVLGRVPVISSRRDMGILRHSKHSMAYRVTAKLYDRVIAVSDQVRKFCITEDRIAPAKVVTLYNGVELRDGLSPRNEIMLAKKHRSRPVVTTVAHIRRVKGIDVLVDVADLVRRSHPDVHFIVVGAVHEPEYFERVREQVKRRDLDSTVSFAGEFDEASEILAGSDVFFLPSRSEGFSNALVEAMLCELPVVATNVGGNSEAVMDGLSGFIVPSEDVNTAADRISLLLHNAALRSEMGARARQSALHRFTADSMIQGLTQIYREVMHA